MARPTCTECDKPSLPGFVPGTGKCQYHWNVQAYGKEWADKVKADSESARSLTQKGGTGKSGHGMVIGRGCMACGGTGYGERPGVCQVCRGTGRATKPSQQKPGK